MFGAVCINNLVVFGLWSALKFSCVWTLECFKI
ncbi:hypothetical protein Tsubulata_005863, partial [Turnera subulata]